MERFFFQEVEPGDIVFVNEMHVPGKGFAPALPGACYVCISVYPDQVSVRTFGLVDGKTMPANDFLPLDSIERVVSMKPPEIEQIDFG